VFIAFVVLGFCARLVIHKFLKRKTERWAGNEFVIETMWRPFLCWFLLLGAYVAFQVSMLSAAVKRLTGEGLASLFALSLIWTTVSLSERLIRFYLGKTKKLQSLVSVASSIARVIIIITGVLVILEIWGAPTLPIILVLITGLFIVGIAFSEHLKVGHLIKLELGQMGHITHISWTRTVIKTSQGDLVIIPNHALMANTIINYGMVAGTGAVDGVQSKLATTLPTALIAALSNREREVLKLIGFGATNREIAEKLIISEHTVKSHLRSILNKLNIRNRQQAAVYAEREGLISENNALKTNS
jgi:DNA-binding CsgD family transcriptional regulator